MIFTRKTSNPYQSCTFSSLITWVLITYGHFFLTIVTIWFLNQIVLYITVPKTNIFVCVLNTYVEIFDFKAQSPTCRPVLNWRYGNETAISAQYKNHKYVQTSQTQGCKVFLLTVKGQLNSEWIYEVIVSPNKPTKNYKDFCSTKENKNCITFFGDFSWL